MGTGTLAPSLLQALCIYTSYVPGNLLLLAYLFLHVGPSVVEYDAKPT